VGTRKSEGGFALALFAFCFFFAPASHPRTPAAGRFSTIHVISITKNRDDGHLPKLVLRGRCPWRKRRCDCLGHIPLTQRLQQQPRQGEGGLRWAQSKSMNQKFRK
jgi:hypothetical protein